MPQHLRFNPLLQTDSYKLSHWWQYPPDARHVYSHLMSRGGFWPHTLFFGLQYILKAYLTGQVFGIQDVVEAREQSFEHFGSDTVFNWEGWVKLYTKHSGRLPLKIRAVPEGTVVPIKNVLMTIENTDPEFPWLTNWAETLLLQVWYPITVATLSFEIKQAIGKDLVRTGSPEQLPFKLHDFGYRGVSSQETAAIGGAAHLVNFQGTDTLAAIALLQQYYKASMPGFSIPAMEHSTVTSWGEDEEAAAYANQLEKSKTPLTACVIDSYDTHNAVVNIFGDKLRDTVLRRPGTVVLRPDSGDPTVVLEDIFNAVAERFGFETNEKGWKVLPNCIRAIQGDGVNYQNILRINSHLIRAGWSMDNLAYGMGGALLQQQNRDTMRFAIKCSAIDRGGVWHEVKKNPKTDPSKASLGGKLNLLQVNSHYVTVPSDDELAYGNVLETVFLDGELKKEYTLDEIRVRAAQSDRYMVEA
jgi:nicotinamide phosphoribosyltransferase